LPHDKSFYGFKHLATKNNGFFLDVGANNGISVLSFTHLNKNYKALSIEANRYHEPSLKNLKKRLKNFDYLITGAGAKNGEMTLYTPTYNNVPMLPLTSMNLEYLKEAAARDYSEKIVNKFIIEEQIVKIIKLDDLNLKPDIIKIDVEGEDYNVLLGLKNTIANCQPFIMVEYSPGLIDDYTQFFDEIDYHLFVYENNIDKFSPLDPDREFRTYHDERLQVNIFCIPEAKLKNIPIVPA